MPTPSTLQDKILALLQTSLIAEELKTAWREKLPTLTEAQQTELLNIFQSEQKIIQTTLQSEQQKNAPQNQTIYRQLLIDMKNLAQTFQKTGLKNAEQKSQTQENTVLTSLEQELSDL